MVTVDGGPFVSSPVPRPLVGIDVREAFGDKHSLSSFLRFHYASSTLPLRFHSLPL